MIQPLNDVPIVVVTVSADVSRRAARCRGARCCLELEGRLSDASVDDRADRHRRAWPDLSWPWPALVRLAFSSARSPTSTNEAELLSSEGGQLILQVASGALPLLAAATLSGERERGRSRPSC